MHHQAVKTPGKGLRVTAWAEDGIIEAAELEGHPFFVGVQWHPERLWQTDAFSIRVIDAFARACAEQMD